MIVVNTRMHTLYIYLPSPYLACGWLCLHLLVLFSCPRTINVIIVQLSCCGQNVFLIIVRYSARATSVIIIGDCAIFLRTVSYNFVMMRIKLLLTFLSECYTESSFIAAIMILMEIPRIGIYFTEVHSGLPHITQSEWFH